jgi:hypothetical protein
MFRTGFRPSEARANSAVSAGFWALGAEAKTAGVRDPFSRPAWSSVQPARPRQQSPTDFEARIGGTPICASPI